MAFWRQFERSERSENDPDKSGYATNAVRLPMISLSNGLCMTL